MKREAGKGSQSDGGGGWAKGNPCSHVVRVVCVCMRLGVRARARARARVYLKINGRDQKQEAPLQSDS